MDENPVRPSRRTSALAVARPVSRAVMKAGQTSRDFIKRRPLGGVSGIVIVVMFAVALAAPMVARYDPLVQHGGRILEGPSWEFWLGTDHLGRDMYSRVVHGARGSVIVGFSAVAIGTAGSGDSTVVLVIVDPGQFLCIGMSLFGECETHPAEGMLWVLALEQESYRQSCHPFSTEGFIAGEDGRTRLLEIESRDRPAFVGGGYVAIDGRTDGEFRLFVIGPGSRE